MAHYTQLTRDEIRAVAASYGYEASSFSALSGGVENTSYRVEVTKGQILITILEKRDLGSAMRYAEFLAGLAELDIPVPDIYRNSDGAYVSTVRGKPVVAMEFLAGTCYDELPDIHLRGAGQVLALVHQKKQVDAAPPPVVRITGTELHRASAFTDQDFVRWLVESHAKTRHVVEEGTGGRGLTHGDLFADNMIVGTEGNIRIIDWENGAIDVLSVDLGMTILGLCGSGPKFIPQRARLFLEGYTSVQELPVPMDELRDSVYYAAIFTAFNRYERHEILTPDSGRQGYYREIPTFVETMINEWAAVQPF